MAVVRSLFGRLSRDATSDLKVADNIVCLSDYDRVPDDLPEAISDPPEAISDPPDAIGVLQEAISVPPEATNVPPRITAKPAKDFVRGNTSDLSEKFTLGIKDVGVPLQTLGELMTATREKTGLTREEVAAETHIPAYYVRMIESDSYDAIPDQLYLLPFFRRYAIFLGLDAQKIVSRFLIDFEKAENEIVDIKALKVPKPPKVAKAPKALKAAKAPAAKDANAKTDSNLLWRQAASAVLVAGVVLIFVARGFGLVGGTAQRTLQHPSSNPSNVATSAITLPPSIVLSSDEVPHPEPQQPAAIPSADVAEPEISAANASPAIEQPPTPAKHHHHRVHSHRIAKHSKHTTHTPG
jgi:cytoskeletal protein RodZ